MVRKVKRRQVTRLDIGRFGGPLEAYPLQWDAVASWWCSWRGRPLDPRGPGTAVPVSGFTHAGAFTEGLYRVRFPGRDVDGLLVAGARDGDMPLGFVTCGQQCADALMAFGRGEGTDRTDTRGGWDDEATL